jgi:uncharacterized protein YcaQ
MGRIAVLQIDSVQVVERAHLVPVFSRLGPYDRGVVERAATRAPRRLVETWAHEASYVRPDVYHALAWRRAGADQWAWGRMRRVAAEHPEVVAEVHALIARSGPMTARETRRALGHDPDHSTRAFGSWDWGLAKSALEYLFYAGELGGAGRTAQFERRYDLAERVIPPSAPDSPVGEVDGQRTLVDIAARALGVATAHSLADYFRMPVGATRDAIAHLVRQGVLAEVAVDSWRHPAYLHREATIPRHVSARALLSPFDSLVFDRRRLEELFAMHHRLEYYVPPERRIWGYYVMPFLLGQEMVARVDLKADRARGTLIVRAAHLEPDFPADRVSAALTCELADLASWLGLPSIRVDDAESPLGARLTRA